MGPQNGIMGEDSNFGTDIPETTAIDESVMNELRKTAKFSRTAEFKELKSYLEGRIGFYKDYLPNGNPIIGEKAVSELGYFWVAANVIIGELQNIIGVYEQAAQQVKDESTRRKRT